MAKKSMAVVLVSGGLDSAVAVELAKQDSRVALLHLSFGQQAAVKEYQAFQQLCSHFEPDKHLVNNLGDWKEISDCPVVNPASEMNDASEGSTFLSDTFLPLLAQSMLCRAAAWAYTLKAQRVVWGISLDNPGNFPDRCDAVRLLCWQLVQRSLPEDREIAIEAPLAQYPKEAVASLARELGIPIEKTWSCLRGGEKPCGSCIGCLSRRKALAAAGLDRAR